MNTLISNSRGIILTTPRFIADKKYNTIVIDPPWPIIWNENQYTGSAMPYQTMSIQQIASLNITDLLQKDSWVFLWTTCSMLPNAFDILCKWGLQYRSIITWVKPYGLGRPPLTATEHCLMAAYGHPTRPHMRGKMIPNYFLTNGGSRSRKHSEKPEEFYIKYSSFFHGNCLEMFARSPRNGWDTWGNQI